MRPGCARRMWRRTVRIRCWDGSAATSRRSACINSYFGGEGNAVLPGVTVLATSMLPLESPKSERVAWCVERTDGGRGFGIVMPHFFRNWKMEDLRRFILNGIVWTTKLDVPIGG